MITMLSQSGSTFAQGLPRDSAITYLAILLTSIIVVGAAQVFVTYMLPDIRSILEMALATLLISTLLYQIVPGLDGNNGFVNWILFVSLFLIVERLVYGHILDPLAPSGQQDFKRSFRTDLRPEQVWAALVPLPENAPTFHYPRTQISVIPDETDAYLASYPLRDGQNYQLERIKVEDCAEPFRFIARFSPAAPSRSAGGLSGKIDIAIMPDGDGSAVVYEETRESAPLRRRIQWFMDDEFGDRMDSVLAHLRKRSDWSMLARQFVRT